MLRSLQPAPERTVLPGLRRFHEARTQRVAFNVPAYDEEVCIILDRKAFEARLVKVTFAGGVVVGVIALGVCRRHPAKHASHHAVLFRLHDQVPMVGHQAEREQLDRIFRQAFAERTKERLVVFGLVKKGLLGVSTVQGMVSHRPHQRVSVLASSLAGEEEVTSQNEKPKLTNSPKKDPRPLFYASPFLRPKTKIYAYLPLFERRRLELWRRKILRLAISTENQQSFRSTSEEQNTTTQYWPKSIFTVTLNIQVKT